jgi:hypothetical protein
MASIHLVYANIHSVYDLHVLANIHSVYVRIPGKGITMYWPAYI